MNVNFDNGLEVSAELNTSSQDWAQSEKARDEDMIWGALDRDNEMGDFPIGGHE